MSRMLSQVHSSSSVPFEKSLTSTMSSMEECRIRSRSDMIPWSLLSASRMGIASNPDISMIRATSGRGVSSQRAKVWLIYVGFISSFTRNWAMAWTRSATESNPTSFSPSTTGSLLTFFSIRIRAASSTGVSGETVAGLRVIRSPSWVSSALRRRSFLVMIPTSFPSLRTGTPEIPVRFSIFRTSSLFPGISTVTTSVVMKSETFMASMVAPP